MNSFELYTNIKNHIENRINELQRKEVIIYPYGQMGLLVKQVLNGQYGIGEKYIVDNGLSRYNENILSFESFKNKINENTLLILTAVNKKAYSEIKQELLRYANSDQIISIIDPVIISRPEKSEYFAILKELLRVRRINPYQKLIRVGRNNDGGYIMVDDFEKSKIAYSFGISDDVSWDKDIANRGIEVFQYDPTIYNVPEKNSLFHFYKIGISGIDDEKSSMLTLKTIMKNNKHADKNNMILKMDVEGAEWDFLKNTAEDNLAQFDQIAFELHGLTNDTKGEMILASIAKLNKTHQLIWIHGNNCSIAEQAKGILIPDCIEVLYVNREKYCFSSSECLFPCEIDQPNNKRIIDFNLGNWGE